MALSRILNVLGLLVSLVGAGMLFFRSIWRQQIGNTIITPDFEWQFQEDLGHSAVPQPTWSPVANKLWRQGRYLNGWGFGMIAFGTALQIAGALL